MPSSSPKSAIATELYPRSSPLPLFVPEERSTWTARPIADPNCGDGAAPSCDDRNESNAGMFSSLFSAEAKCIPWGLFFSISALIVLSKTSQYVIERI